MFLSWHGEQFQIYKICTCNYAPLRHGLCQCRKVYLKINELGAVFFFFFFFLSDSVFFTIQCTVHYLSLFSVLVCCLALIPKPAVLILDF